jgi:hypothetical protein
MILNYLRGRVSGLALPCYHLARLLRKVHRMEFRKTKRVSRYMKTYSRFLAGVTAMLVGGILPLSASTVTFNYGTVSAGTAPGGAPPWLQAVFSDTGSANTVQLTLNAANLAGTEFVSGWYFNLNPAMDPKALSFSLAGSNPSIQTGKNYFKAGPDGKFDLLLGFSTANNGNRFVNGDSLTLTITGNGLTASDFDYLSTPGGGNDGYGSSAHIQAISPYDKSGWINPSSTVFTPSTQRVPDGSETAVLLGVSLLIMEALRRKIQARALARASARIS